MNDPAGLLDRDLLNFDLRYQTFVSDAVALQQLTRDWYAQWRDEKGEPGSPALTDEHHGYWRAMTEYDRWRTVRRAYQEAWPLATSGGGGTHEGTSRLRAQGHYFVTENGEHWTAIGATDFNLLKHLCDGADIDGLLRQRRDVGFNMVRVFLVGDWGDPAYLCRPQDHPDYYQRLGELADRCAAHGLYLQACAFCDSSRIFPTLQLQQEHWRRVCDALRDKPNVLLELVNENDLGVNHIDQNAFGKPDGILSSHGSNGSQQLAVRGWWDWEAFHTNDAPEWTRKVGHNAMEMCDGTPEWPPSHVPIISNENTRCADRYNNPTWSYDAAAGAALLCAGSVYHSAQGKLSRFWDGAELENAHAWVNGARSVPLEYQDGRYLRDDNLAPNELRRYGRRLGDGRVHWVVIHR